MRTSKYSPFLAVFLSLSLLQARQDQLSCGSHENRWREELHLHERALISGKKRPRTAPMAAGEQLVGGFSVLPDQGNIAVLDDADGVVARRNPFNLDRKTVSFVPSGGSSYRYEVQGDTYDAAAASAGALQPLQDDDSRTLPLPFTFRFYGVPYTEAYVNSDGNLTFRAGDASTADRSLGRLNSGLPRIAGLFRDLDPAKARGGVSVNASPQRVIVSWSEVPEYQDFGTGPLQTFQIRLFPSGRIEFAYAGVTSSSAVVGISPGGLQGPLSIVSFANQPTAEYGATLAERFSTAEDLDIFTAAQKFYLNHEDSYDYLVLYNALNIPADAGAVALEVTVRNSRSGYGDTKVDVGNEAGSRRRLQAILNMGPLSQYPADPSAIVPARFTARDTPLTVLGHETGHLFLAFASVRDPGNSAARPMLGRQTAHWNFLFNSEASLLEGNRIEDRGPGVSPRFRTTGTVEGYSPLDQYLMGFRAPEEVPDTFLVERSSIGSAGTMGPQTGVTFDGDRRDVTIGEIVQAEGRRTPDHSVSQRRFRFAFALVTAAGRTPAAEELAQLDRYRTEFEAFFERASGGRASADTSLRRALQVSTFPAAGVMAGSSGAGTVSLEGPASSPVTISLRSTGLLRTPPSVTIPAGASQATFEYAGIRPGTDSIIADSADSRYEVAVSRIQIAESRDLALVVRSGDRQSGAAGTPLRQPVEFRLTDINDLPYPGVRVQATLTGGGSVSPVVATTDQNGIARFSWTPGSGVFNELRASIAGGPAAAATVLGFPQFAAANVVNAASFVPGVAAGGIATVFGSNLAGAQVLINGTAQQVFYSDARQVNFLVPAQTPLGAANLELRTSVGTAEPARVNIEPYAPGIFFDPVSGLGAILSRDGILEIYATGLGPVRRDEDGLDRTTSLPAVQIAGRSAEVLFSGLAPGFQGLYQVNVWAPQGLPSGPHALTLEIGGKRSNEVKTR